MPERLRGLTPSVTSKKYPNVNKSGPKMINFNTFTIIA